METLCFATFARALQGALLDEPSNEKITDLLLKSVIDKGDVRGSDGSTPYAVDAKLAEKLLNRKVELYSGIRKASGMPDVIEYMADYFDEEIACKINENRRLDLLSDITKLIEHDESISPAQKELLLKNANDFRLTQFLADTLLYALSKQNKATADGRRRKSEDTSAQLVPAESAINAYLMPDEALKNIVGQLTSALYATSESEAARFQDFQSAEFHEAVQELIRAGKMTYYELYKCKNFLEIAEKADKELHSEDVQSCDSEDFDFDWFLRFFEAAGNISNQEMQDLWAKVLAGEIEHQGSFSLRTMETLRNMTAREARIFQRVSHLVLSETDGSQFLFCDDSIGNYDLNERHGLSTQDLFLLEECGLVNAFCINNEMMFEDGLGGFASDCGKMILIEPVNMNNKPIFHYKSYPISRAASQLLPIVWDGEYDDYLIDLGKILKEENAGEFIISAHDITGIKQGNEIELDLDHDLLLD